MLARLASMIRRATSGRRRLVIAACSAALLSPVSLGCTGSAHLRSGVVFDYPVYYVERAPPRIWRYPSAYYHGRPAYLIGGRWYYSTPRGWVVFRREPRELRSYRENRFVRRHYEPDRPPRRYRDDEPTQHRRESYDSRNDEPSERRHRRVDPN
jgi:hypothetical protein